MNLDVRHSCNKGAYSYVQKLGEKMDQTFEKRKKIIYEFICDDMYVPMKLKELAILLQVPKEQRSELKAVMDARCLSGTSARIWLCNDRRGDR